MSRWNVFMKCLDEMSWYNFNLRTDLKKTDKHSKVLNLIALGSITLNMPQIVDLAIYTLRTATNYHFIICIDYYYIGTYEPITIKIINKAFNLLKV